MQKRLFSLNLPIIGLTPVLSNARTNSLCRVTAFCLQWANAEK